MLLTPRDTAGEKAVEVFRGAGEGAVELGLEALAAVVPAPVDREALMAAVSRLAGFVAGETPTTAAEIEQVVRGVLPGFRHAQAQASLDDRV